MTDPWSEFTGWGRLWGQRPEAVEWVGDMPGDAQSAPVVMERADVVRDLAQRLGIDPNVALQAYADAMTSPDTSLFAGASDYANMHLRPGQAIVNMLRRTGQYTPEMERQVAQWVDEGNTLKDQVNAQDKAKWRSSMMRFGSMLAPLAIGGFTGALSNFNPLGTAGAAEAASSPIVAELGSLGLSEAAAANAALGGTGMADLAATASAMGVDPALLASTGLSGYLADPSQAAQFSGELGGRTVSDIQNVQGYMPTAQQTHGVYDGLAASNAAAASEAARYSGELGGRTEADIGATKGAIDKGAVTPSPKPAGTPDSFLDRLKSKALEKGASKALDYFMQPSYDYTGTGAARVDNGYSPAGINPFRMGNLENLFGGDIDAITEEAMRQLGFATGRQGLQQSSVEAEGKEAIGRAEQGYKEAVDSANKTAEQIFQEQQQSTKEYGDSLAAQGYGTDAITQALGELPTSADAYVAEPELPNFGLIDLVARGGSPLPTRKKRKTGGASDLAEEQDENYAGQIVRT